MQMPDFLATLLHPGKEHVRHTRFVLDAAGTFLSSAGDLLLLVLVDHSGAWGERRELPLNKQLAKSTREVAATDTSTGDYERTLGMIVIA